MYRTEERKLEFMAELDKGPLNLWTYKLRLATSWWSTSKPSRSLEDDALVAATGTSIPAGIEFFGPPFPLESLRHTSRSVAGFRSRRSCALVDRQSFRAFLRVRWRPRRRRRTTPTYDREWKKFCRLILRPSSSVISRDVEPRQGRILSLLSICNCVCATK